MTAALAAIDAELLALMRAIADAERPGAPLESLPRIHRERIERIAEAVHRAGWRRDGGGLARSLDEALNTGDGSYRP